ncbi:hypothetical protein [Nostoc sp.]|uniref:hypothetical protein n=1 Tax=Nostoc sp. TaxID=1180 RepID=UPI002FFC06B4
MSVYHNRHSNLKFNKFSKNTRRLEIAATQTFVRLRGLKEFETHGGGFCLYSRVRPWRAGGIITIRQGKVCFYKSDLRKNSLKLLFFTAEIYIDVSVQVFRDCLVSSLESANEVLKEL